MTALLLCFLAVAAAREIPGDLSQGVLSLDKAAGTRCVRDRASVAAYDVPDICTHPLNVCKRSKDIVDRCSGSLLTLELCSHAGPLRPP